VRGVSRQQKDKLEQAHEQLWVPVVSSTGAPSIPPTHGAAQSAGSTPSEVEGGPLGPIFLFEPLFPDWRQQLNTEPPVARSEQRPTNGSLAATAPWMRAMPFLPTACLSRVALGDAAVHAAQDATVLNQMESAG